MKSSTGRWVAGRDFFDRQSDLAILRARVEDRNHVLLSGQRRMGKTSLLKELSRHLIDEGWTVLFVDVESVASSEDAVAEIATAAFEHVSVITRFAETMRSWLNQNVEELDVQSFRVKFRSQMDSRSWRRYGDRVLKVCADSENPVLLVIDELPIVLNKMLQVDGNPSRVEEFLSWLRSATQTLGENSPVVFLSGSIGLAPLVNRLGLSDRINCLDPIQLRPWSRETSIKCIEALAETHGLTLEDSVADAMYDALGLGIPHHVQSFFARMRDHSIVYDRKTLRIEDVRVVYRSSLLGARGQNDLVHYATRLKEAFDDDAYSIAMEILAEASVEDAFTIEARNSLVAHYEGLYKGVENRIVEALDVLEHDGYLERTDTAYQFSSNLLKDWWASRFRDHHVPLKNRLTKS